MAMTDHLQNGPPLSPAKMDGEGDTSPLLSLVKLTKSGLLLFTFPKSTSRDVVDKYCIQNYSFCGIRELWFTPVTHRLQKVENINSVLYPDNRLFQYPNGIPGDCMLLYTVNGVSKVHSELLNAKLFKDCYELWPQKFQCRTNGVTQV
ncbi:PREDICTED: glycogen/starch/alpha-glucan phosphorylase [Prunus dulcis]|uniref:Alpha-1,4 glucan phosphorylase n=1 Tax=Prunus dulcis TaxID=3755 RepID=A0A5E4ELZ3_PRUDU|nr:PREDICTED: glycogen/starch/alpha-glucan phosphorylase [Prunus dulcis]